jgi:hypothetical protein
MIEPRQNALHAIEGEIDLARMQLRDPRDDVAERRLGGWTGAHA